MKRLLFVLLSSAIIIAGYAMYSRNDLGLMQVSFAEYYYEANLLEVGLGVLGVIFTCLLLAYTFSLMKKLAGLLGKKRSQQLAEKARHSLEQGLIELSEGRFAQAEKMLLQKIGHNENALLAYLTAARAAQYQGAHDRRDEYIRCAHRSAPDADIAIGLTQAELQMDHNQFEQALATLNHLNALSPHHSYVLKLLAKTHCRLADWDRLRRLLPEVKKAGAITDDKLLSLEIETWCGLISDRSKTGNVNVLTELWDEIPRNMKLIPEIIEHYARELVKLHASGEAEQVLRDYLSNHWIDSTVMLYAELDVMAGEKQIEIVEQWLQDHQHNEYLLFALGKMCINRNLWSKARNYLEASLSVKPMPATYLKLAQLLEDHMDERRQAQEYYRQGLHMLAGDYGEDALAKAENDFQRVIMKPELRVI
ncbi:MAG: heme biosynthesis HemY N-terminal domain-containing protein [Gammaproteobacteria bacterium]|jgi:HemY protein